MPGLPQSAQRSPSSSPAIPKKIHHHHRFTHLPPSITPTMSSRKPRRNNNHNHNNNNHNHNHNLTQNHLTDYESDAAYFSDMQQQQQPGPPSRTNEEINLSVLRRHNPDITSILSLAQYVVVYIFSPTTRQWEKNGVEGTLFVCQLTQGSLGEERYTAFVLNRRGLNNFDLQLTDGDNVELTEEYVILKADEGAEDESGANGLKDPSKPQGRQANGTSTPGLRIYGIWIYSEPSPNSTAQARTINAEMIRECATHAGQSLKIMRERLEAMRQNGLHEAAAAAVTHAAPLEEVQASVPMGRQISLKDLFGQQRAQDDGWSVRAHHISPVEQPQAQQQHYQQIAPQQFPQPPPQQYPQQHYQQPQAYPGMMPQQQQQPPPPPQPQADVLGDLFRKAGFAYQGGGQG
ncbi:Dcp1-like decapping [Penicillium canariense]|uniref:Dcp1-like decapping n=1 Tax=Penicillium canariense TaxID=189055 RepID=A0A9W9IK24_9EURO|nr:Dcp1-like decapping [Penicillium canariense]KAJ5177136.1 Dcp1-like decapping [Penicillium canariense]